eukprot:2763251-Rhodomonas_salina.1
MDACLSLLPMLQDLRLAEGIKDIVASISVGAVRLFLCGSVLGSECGHAREDVDAGGTVS